MGFPHDGQKSCNSDSKGTLYNNAFKAAISCGDESRVNPAMVGDLVLEGVPRCTPWRRFWFNTEVWSSCYLPLDGRVPDAFSARIHILLSRSLQWRGL